MHNGAGAGSFLFQSSLNSFRVVAQNGARNSILGSVRFVLADDAIEVLHNDLLAFKGVNTLCDDGRCRLKVGDRELDLWQFRKRALEDLFFGRS